MNDQLNRDLGGRPASSTSPSSSQQSAGRNLISVIGIDQYENLQILHNAVSDARGIRSLFVDQLGFDEITDPLYDRAATYDALMSLVRDELSSKLEPDDNLVIFFAGHGYTETHTAGNRAVKTGYLIPVEGCRPEDKKFSTYVKLESFLEDVARLPARHILVILDSCYSGFALGDSVHTLRSPGDYSREMNRRMSRRVITSAMADQPALDSGPVKGHSLFTGTLIEALVLGKADNDHKGFVTGSELGLHVQKNVADWSKAKQTPDFGAFELDDRGELIIGLTGELPTETGFLTAITQGPDEGSIHLRLNPPQFTLLPGYTLRVSVEVYNLGDRPGSIQMTLRGLPEDWAKLSMNIVQLDPGREKKVTLTLNPPRLPQAKAGERIFTIHAVSLQDSQQSTEIEGRMELASYTQFVSSLEPNPLAAGQECEITIENSGNHPETFQVEFIDPSEALVFEPSNADVQVREGQTKVIAFNAAPKSKRLFGGIEEYDFSVQISHPKTTPHLHKVELLSGPLISNRLVIILVLIIFVAVVGGLLAIFLPRNPPSSGQNQPNATQTFLYSDPDGDGLSNFDEQRLRTDPNDPDTDGDGISDFDDPQPLIAAVVPETPTHTSTISPTPSPSPTSGSPTLTSPTPTSGTPTATITHTPTPTLTPDIPETPLGGSGFLGIEFNELPYTVILDEPVETSKHKMATTLSSWTSQSKYSEFRISPDGEKIAFWLRAGPGIGTLFVLESNGRARQVGEAISGSMAWDISSKTLAYVCRGTKGDPGFALANPAICIVTTAGGQPSFILDSSDFNETHTITTLAWSPDSRQVAFASDFQGENLNIYTVSVSVLSRLLPATRSIKPVQITHDQEDAAFPSFSPDGEWIVYSLRDDGGDFEIYLISTLGTNKSAALTNNAVDDCWSEWSPDGKWLAYTSRSCGIDSAVDPSGIIMLIPSNGGTASKEITPGAKPVWLPAGE